MVKRKEFLSGEIIAPQPLNERTSLADLIDRTFLSYNAGRLREGCQVFTYKMLKRDVTIGVSLSGALTPAGLGGACVVPLMEKGYVDWIVSTGANLYHDIHFALGLRLRKGTHCGNDVALRKAGVVRIYDIVFDYQVLLKTDAYVRRVLSHEEFQRDMGTAELHHLLGKYLQKEEEARGTRGGSILAAAYRLGIPIFSPSPGDSSIGMNSAGLALENHRLKIDVSLDVNESAAIVYHAKKKGGKSGVVILGGGSPKNFLLQTEPHIQEILGLSDSGHDYFIQITDARPDTGGLSGATPSEAISWGKINPQGLPNTVVAYLDATVALPLITAYALARGTPRPHKRLYEKRDTLVHALRRDYLRTK
jgi:deoxyhypusine synthase